MKTIMVRYKTLEAHADLNATQVRGVFAQLREAAPSGIRYACYRLADGVSFVHVATVEHADTNPIVELPAFKAFQADLKSRCVEPPVFTEMTLVGHYGQA
jgi:hypothetical protein